MTTSTFRAAYRRFGGHTGSLSLCDAHRYSDLSARTTRPCSSANRWWIRADCCSRATPRTVYNIVWLDTHDGPLVIEVPPDVLGVIDDFWFRYVTDVGKVGPDQGRGGKYTACSPGYADLMPGCCALSLAHLRALDVLSRLIENGDLRPAIENAKTNFRVYPLARQTARDALRELLGTDVQHHPRQRRLLLHGGRTRRPRGTAR